MRAPTPDELDRDLGDLAPYIVGAALIAALVGIVLVSTGVIDPAQVALWFLRGLMPHIGSAGTAAITAMP